MPGCQSQRDRPALRGGLWGGLLRGRTTCSVVASHQDIVAWPSRARRCTLDATLPGLRAPRSRRARALSRHRKQVDATSISLPRITTLLGQGLGQGGPPGCVEMTGGDIDNARLTGSHCWLVDTVCPGVTSRSAELGPMASPPVTLQLICRMAKQVKGRRQLDRLAGQGRASWRGSGPQRASSLKQLDNLQCAGR